MTADRFLNLLRCKIFCLWIFRRHSSTNYKRCRRHRKTFGAQDLAPGTPGQQDPITQPRDSSWCGGIVESLTRAILMV